MNSSTWEVTKNVVEVVFYGLSAAAVVWRLGGVSGGIHAKLDQLLGTQQRQEKRLNRVQQALRKLWNSVRTLRRRVDVISSACPACPERRGHRPNPEIDGA